MSLIKKTLDMKLPSSPTVFSYLTRMNSGPFQVELMHEKKESPWGTLHGYVICRLISIHQLFCEDWGFRTLSLSKLIYNSCNRLDFNKSTFLRKNTENFKKFCKSFISSGDCQSFFLPSCSYIKLKTSKS